jgi:hypothetical protein
MTAAELVPCTPRALRLNLDIRDPLPHMMVMLDRLSERAKGFRRRPPSTSHLHLPLRRFMNVPQLTTLHRRQDLPDHMPLYQRFAEKREALVIARGGAGAGQVALLRSDPCASAFLTSDCEMPNCLAIADGLTPALKAARTAFSLPVVKPALVVALRRSSFASASWFGFFGLGGVRPRRSDSTVTAVSSASISPSSNRFRAPAKSVGKEWRRCEAKLPGPALPIGTVEGPAALTVGRAENRSGVVPEGRRFGMPQLCRRWLAAATAGSPSQHIVLVADRLLLLK